MSGTKCGMNVEDQHHVGQPTTALTEAQVAKVKEVFDSDRRLTIAHISEKTGLSVGTIYTIGGFGYEKSLHEAGAKS